MKKGTIRDTLVKGAIRDALVKALKANPVRIHASSLDGAVFGFEIDEEIYLEDAAVNKILGDYSWWKG